MPGTVPFTLRRHLGFVDVLALAVGSVIGTGIFLLPGKAAAAMGPAAGLALLVGAALVAMLVLCYAEAASRFEGTGGAMVYARVAFGEVWGFEVGWATWIARIASWGGLAGAFVTALVPLWPAVDAWPPARPLLIALLIGGLTLVNLRGVRIGGRANTVLTALKLLPLLAFVGIGLFYIEPSRFTPFAPQGYGPLGETTVLMLYAYVGFEGMVIPAAEVQDPRRSIPRALLLGMVAIFAVYAGVWTVCVGTLDGLAAEANNPVGAAAAGFLGPAGATLIHVGIVVSVVGINAFMALVTPRALYALSEARLLPGWSGSIGRNGVPTRAILLTAGATLVLAWNYTFAQLAVISVVARIAQYVPTCLAVLWMRRRPDLPSAEFRAPLGPVLPWVAVAVCVWLLYETPAEQLLWGAVAVLGGLLLHLPWRSFRT